MKVFSSKLTPARNQHFWAGKYTLTKLLSPNGVPLLDQVLLATISSLNHAERHNTLLDWKNAQRVFHSQHSNGCSLCYDVRFTQENVEMRKIVFDRELQGHQAPECYWQSTLFLKTNFKCEIAAAARGGGIFVSAVSVTFLQFVRVRPKITRWLVNQIYYPSYNFAK